MAGDAEMLPSWRPGAVRDAVLRFLGEARHVPVEKRVACLDNDGTLWCEKPTYAQLDFFVDVMRTAVADDPSLAKKPEFAALLTGDAAAVGDLGLERIAFALAGLCAGLTPDAFTALVREFMATARHPLRDRLVRATTYAPMLELLEELRRLDFSVSIVTGGGTEFVRAISQDLYHVAPEAVVGTLIGYDYSDDGDRPVLRRSTTLLGVANEGAAKVSNIQTQLGRRPILAAGNSGGDREMLEWAATGEGPTLALLVDHDDDAREFSYVSTAQTFTETEPVTVVGERLGWTVVSMARDWETVFGPVEGDGPLGA